MLCQCARRFRCNCVYICDSITERDQRITPTHDHKINAAAGEESPVRFGVLTAIGVTLLFQFGAQLVLLRYKDPSLLPAITALTQISLMLVPTIYAARAQELPTRELFRLHKVSPGFHLAAIVGIITLWPVVQSYLIVQELYLIPEGWYDAYRQIQQRLEHMYDRLIPIGGYIAPLISLVVAGLIPGLCEEVVFRGATQRSFERRMRPAMAITLSSLLFAGLHLQPHNFIPLLLLGSFLGLIAWSSGSIYPAIAGHFFFNALMIGALYTMRASGERPSTHSEADLVALLPGVIVCVIGLAVVVRWLIIRGIGRDATKTTPTPVVASPTFEDAE